MKLIVGLGNIGENYKKTRHNIGFMSLEEIKNNYIGHEFKKSNFLAEIAEVKIENQRTVLLKPTTYMNSSGDSVSRFMKYNTVSIEDIVVIHDDMEISIGDVKAKIGGSNKGHNGLRSISAQIGNEYTRIRIGIGRPNNKNEVSNYVLANFLKSEMNIIEDLMIKISGSIHLIINNKINEFNLLFQKAN